MGACVGRRARACGGAAPPRRRLPCSRRRCRRSHAAPAARAGPRSENLTYYTGAGYLVGALLGGARGSAQALSAPVAVAGVDSGRLRLNALLNTGGKMGRSAGNSLGVLGLLFASFESFLGCGGASGQRGPRGRQSRSLCLRVGRRDWRHTPRRCCSPRCRGRRSPWSLQLPLTGAGPSPPPTPTDTCQTAACPTRHARWVQARPRARSIAASAARARRRLPRPWAPLAARCCWRGAGSSMPG